jgi:hypothetical protein
MGVKPGVVLNFRLVERTPRLSQLLTRKSALGALGMYYTCPYSKLSDFFSLDISAYMRDSDNT